MSHIQARTVALLVTDGFEEVELTKPKKALEDAGHIAHIVSPKTKTVKAWAKTDWGKEYDVDVPLSKADVSAYDLLVLPGGVLNPDELRTDDAALAFVRGFVRDGKPIAAICHGPWTLAEVDALDGKRVTSYPSISTDLRNAGATWVDEEVVTDGTLITSRNPDDLPAFNRAILAALA